MAKPDLREVKLWTPDIGSEERDDGSILVWRNDPLGPYPDKITERLVHWAEVAPDRPWMAERGDDGDWVRISYGEALEKVRSVAQKLIDFGLSEDRPVAILSDKSLDHALLALAAQHVGIPSAAISTAYSLVSTDYEKLRDIAAKITPGLVFAADGEQYAAAIEAAFPAETPVVVSRNKVPGRKSDQFETLVRTQPTDAVDRAHADVTPDTVAKFLFTSGTTGSPKAVIQTHRMLCSNQEMIADCYAFMREEPPIIVDWAPWNHTASGNKVFNLVLYNGGTYYIDAGKPAPNKIGETIHNLRDISPTWYFNVPAGYEMLVDAMETDEALRKSFFADLKMIMYAGAGMAQHTWDRLDELAVKTIGRRVLLATGLGSTETAPFALKCTEEQSRPGNVGIPSQGVTLKLVPDEEKLEARLKGPNITPGYWRDPELTAAAFDEEGFYKLGDALKFAEPGRPEKGFFFDGRLAENFKLETGTWVAVGALRAKLVNEMDGYVRDAVIAGENQPALGALLLPYIPKMRSLVPEEAELRDHQIVGHEKVRAKIAELLAAHAAAATGSATRVTRAVIMEEEPSLDRGEVTDKGSINQRAVLRHRDHLVDLLFSDDEERVIRARKKEPAA
ncbi:feruloyl-CoA synthase [Amorphus orientalis]|uniref:Feruloyl-CoA synthase n=1 Tax=Amorphus orientalis TaxID=649198 RepID=A0AAE4AUD6_9HYPH|nr:feruloyl-CoA synthase [Amorphus orientalis]MDQ0317280.1 feruloyl-CoA synthase [Amorphus orientalis]